MNARYLKYLDRAARFSGKGIFHESIFHTFFYNRLLLDSITDVLDGISTTTVNIESPYHQGNERRQDLERIGSDMYKAIEQLDDETRQSRVQPLQS